MKRGTWYGTMALAACALAGGEETAKRASEAAGKTTPAYPLWDGKESQADYARRVGLEPTLNLDCGKGVTMELVLIPAGKFIMGTPQPAPVNDAAFLSRLRVSQAALALGASVLAVLLSTVVIQAIRRRRRPQYSLRRLLAMTFFAGTAVLGGTGWWDTGRRWEHARTECAAAEGRYEVANFREKRAHKVIITRPFYMARYETTQEEYEAVLENNPSHFKGPKSPVETVSWRNAQEFCKKLSQEAGYEVRLPTEAEWEYACRAGTQTDHHSGDNMAALERAAWYCVNSQGSTHPVGQKEANAFGLYDMHGNVSEWCHDAFITFDYYSQSPTTDPQGEAPAEGAWRLLRGGSWKDCQPLCRSACCPLQSIPDLGCDFEGFRAAVGIASRTP